MMKSSEIREIFSEVLSEDEMKFMEPMKNHTSLRIGGPADIFSEPKNLPSLIKLLKGFARYRIPFYPLGGGTNMLVRDGGMEGAVLSLGSFRKTETMKEDNEYVYISAEAGALLQRLVHFSREHGYAGLEAFAGIPGTVGGAVCGNAGAFGYEIKDVIVSVERMNAEGQIKRINAEGIVFGYRSSGILSDELILSAEIKLRKDKKEEVSGRIENFLKIKREKQPIWEASAGCVFRNPSGLSAGKSIDEAGCKGMRIGDVEVSTLHANFFINKGSASAADFLRLMAEVTERVKANCNILLEPEIKIVGRESVN
jgi:UDP-N-acetylmuramate dehydrogenase